MATVAEAKTATVKPGTVKLALCQILCGEDKKKNIETARSAVEGACANGAELVILPECWNSPYDTSAFPVYCEPIPTAAADLTEELNPSTSFLVNIAKEKKIWLIGGSIPEKDQDGNVFNTCIIVNPDGEIVAKHRKVHLFDIDVPGKITFKESDTLSPGNSSTTFKTPYGTIGVAICYDIRFPELSMLMRSQGASLLVFPGAFNMTTGPAHWELLQRARAVDNQCFVAAVSPARNPESSYQAWGHSTVVSPWGKVLATTEHEPATVYAEVDLSEVEEVRQGIPVSKQKRGDLYALNG
eukprot:CAMPEP_0170184856 /NCGR_PEP_ID=MMETSP0040_2-20121228/34841_1 /TAXON_ID=641309 /ORGANISM="Lotharella oceanica, Strain CCMP622" /LENGTH=297 /DNA_ID=CAMNT_0010431047 /DNA_START=68 /DNA_END=961 /DNA_ORIENTATION=-